VGATYSALVGRAATQPLPVPVRALAYRAFARAVGANLDEAEHPLEAYESLGELFARGLRPGARPVDARPDSVISPCDGVIAARGIATAGTLLQAKGRHYQLEQLIADRALAARLAGGDYVTIYLSPRDYHRVHAPVAGRLEAYEYLPGALWPVSPRITERRDALLARNERVVLHLAADGIGDVALVMVGAAGVGNIRIVHGDAPDSARLRSRGERHRVELASRGLAIPAGGELGAFLLGSTVVVVFPPGRVALAGEPGQAVRCGERLGRRA
jgi:phosphatidylserine decarboxylase